MENQQVVWLSVDGKEFKAKKDLLMEYSDYFRAMFSGNFVENDQRKIQIDVVDACSMEIILRYMELGFIVLSDYSLATVGTLFSAAMYLQITELTKQINYCLEEMLSLCNWLEIKEIAQKAPSQELEQSAVTFGLMSFKDMKPEYIPTIQILFWYLSHPYLYAESELQVFIFGVRWLELKKMNAQEVMIILYCLDYTKLQHSELIEMKRNTMFTEENFLFDIECSTAQDVINGLFHISKVSDLSIKSIAEHKELLYKDNEQLGEEHYTLLLNIIHESIQRKLKLTPALPMWTYEGRAQGKAELSPNFLYTYSHESGFTKWLEISAKNYWGWSLTTWSPTRIVMCCGENGRGTGKFMRDVRVYDIHKKEWIHHGVCMPPRRHAGIAVLGDELYILGGVGAYSLVSPSDDNAQTAEASDSSGKIKVKCSFGGRVFSFYMGRGTGDSKNAQRIVLDSAMVYNLKDRSFRQIAKLPDAIQSPAVCVFENEVYMAGHKHIYKYVNNGTNDRWDKVIETSMSPNFLVPVNGYIHVAQNYFDWLFRLKPGVDTELKNIARLEHPPVALCVIGSRLLGFTLTIGAEDDNSRLTVEEYELATGTGLKSRRVHWSQNFSKCGVHSTGSCVVVIDPPPIEPGISEFHQEILKANAEGKHMEFMPECEKQETLANKKRRSN